MSVIFPGDRINNQNNYLGQPNGPGAGIVGTQTQQIVIEGETVNAGVGVSTGEETWDIPDETISRWISGVLGYALKSDTQINRILPVQHPVLPFMWASGVSGQGIGPRGQKGSQALWKRWRTKIHFETPPYAILPNSQVTKEYQRFLTLMDFSSNSEFFQRREGTFKYSSQAPGLSGNKVDIPETYGAAQLVTKVAQTYLWVQVPDNGLFTGGFPGAPTKLAAGVGKVNSASFFGYEAGTLLFDSWKPIARVFPASPGLLGLPPQGVPRCWDVQLRFIYFNPPSGMDDTTTAGGRYGHNLVPHPVNGLWYLAYLKNSGGVETDTTLWRYQTYNFDLLFEMN